MAWGHGVAVSHNFCSFEDYARVETEQASNCHSQSMQISTNKAGFQRYL